MSAQHTPEALAGKLYVYRDHDTHDAIGVSRFAVGPNGGMVADGIARMANPSKRVSQGDLNKFAQLFVAAPELLEALEMLIADFADYSASEPLCLAFGKARAAIAKAKGGEA